MPYNRTNALVYEAILFISRFWPKIKFNPWVKKILENCRDDWAEFRTQIVMAELDEEVEELHKIWEREEAEHFEPIFIQEEADGSEAQRLLGGPIRLTSSWSCR